MPIIIDWEKYFTKKELQNNLEKFVEKTAYELKNELRKKSNTNIVSSNLVL